MTPLVILLLAAAVLALGGRLYSRFLARSVGEDVSRPTPAVSLADGRDYVPSPTPVVFAHHFASIAGAGPIVGPVIALAYGWLPALLWVVAGGLLVGAVHDYLATYMATREGGQSIATVARRLLGQGPFIALMIFLVIMLALVCATFLNLSATALTTCLPQALLKLDPAQTLLRVAPGDEGPEVLIGGIASTSVIVITVMAPLLGWLYIRKQVPVWKCSLLAVAVCAASIVLGLYLPVNLPKELTLPVLGTFSGTQVWMLLLSAYCMVAAGVPVWIFLQSRDFINVHILYVGLAGLVLTLVVAGIRSGGGELAPQASGPLPAVDIAGGEKALGGPIWPMLFITIACGAVSGFHSLCAGGTTAKQLKTERATRTIGYGAMLLESFLAVCVIAVVLLGLLQADYLKLTHPASVGLDARSNPIVTFAMAVGSAGHMAFGLPIAFGTIAGMVLLEGFLVTTLDTAIRLMRYLIEEIWHSLLGRYDVFASPVAADEPQDWRGGEPAPAGADGLPAAPAMLDQLPAPATSRPAPAALRPLLKALRMCWVNSGLAIVITLLFAFTGGATALWAIFATANQLLAAFGLLIASLWLLRQGRRSWFALAPAMLMLATTVVSLVMLLGGYLATYAAKPAVVPLLIADIVMLAITVWLLVAGAMAVRRLRRQSTQRRPRVMQRA